MQSSGESMLLRPPQPSPMEILQVTQANRFEICKEIEAHRQRPLIVYATNKRQGAAAQMAMDVMPFMADQLSGIPKDTKGVDLLIAGFGGDPMVSWRIMSSIRERVGSVSVLVPQSAYSAATLLALGADEIVMHPNANLGPIDMQITATSAEKGPQHFSTEDVEAFLDFVKDRLGLTDQEHLRRLFETWLSPLLHRPLPVVVSLATDDGFVGGRVDLHGLLDEPVEQFAPRC